MTAYWITLAIVAFAPTIFCLIPALVRVWDLTARRERMVGIGISAISFVWFVFCMMMAARSAQ